MYANPIPITTPADPDPRRAASDLTAAGIANGLPIPRDIEIGDTRLTVGRLSLHLGSDNQAAVEQWASWLDLPVPEMTLHPMRTDARPHSTGWFQPYRADALRHPATGHAVTVVTYVTVPAPTAAEQGGESR